MNSYRYPEWLQNAACGVMKPNEHVNQIKQTNHLSEAMIECAVHKIMWVNTEQIAMCFVKA